MRLHTALLTGGILLAIGGLGAGIVWKRAVTSVPSDTTRRLLSSPSVTLHQSGATTSRPLAQRQTPNDLPLRASLPRFAPPDPPPVAVPPGPPPEVSSPSLERSGSRRSYDDEIFAALNIPPEQQKLVRDVLQLSRERFEELVRGRRGISDAEFATIVKTVREESTANLRAVLGPEKLAEWRAYQRRRSPEVVQAIADRYGSIVGQEQSAPK
jgi:hypothetical protein